MLILSMLLLVVFTLVVIQIILSLLAPGVAETIGLYPFRFWWMWWIIDIVVYGLSITVLILIGLGIGRFIEKRIPIDLDHLKASMISTSLAVISGAIFVFMFVTYLLDYQLATTLFIIAILFALIPSLISWLVAPAIINVMYRCRYDPQLQKIVDRVATRAGMKPPKAVVAEMPIPNAFAYSSPLMGRYVAITTGLFKTVSRDGLEAVIGHELGHHKHRDNAVIMLFGLIPSTIYFVGRFLLYIGFVDRYSDGGERRRSGGGMLFMIVGVVLIVVSILLQVAVLSLSRLREHYADAHGAKVTSPFAMIGALKSLDQFYRSTGARKLIADSKIKPLFIYSLAESLVGFEEMLSTHPPIYKRIAFLESLIGKEIEA
ncbi:MAG: zinc metalloprotease HtpX [Ignisphaera sp.]